MVPLIKRRGAFGAATHKHMVSDKQQTDKFRSLRLIARIDRQVNGPQVEFFPQFTHFGG